MKFKFLNLRPREDSFAPRRPLQTKSTPLAALQFTDSALNAVWSGRDFGALSREGYQKNAIVFRCVRLIAEAASSVPICVRRGEARAAGDPAERFLNRGHPGASFDDIMEQFYGYLHVSGNAYLEAAMVDGVPAGLYALRPDRVKTLTGNTGWPSGYDYEASGYKRTFRIDSATGRSAIFQAKLFNPLDECNGHSPLAAAASAVDFSPADMDFMSARRDAARDIALAFGVPPMLLGIPGDNSYSNYKEANLAFWRQTIIPLVSKTARGMERWLQPFYGDDLRLVPQLDSVSALSSERAQLWARLGGARFISDAERRQMAGLSAAAGGPHE